MPNQASYWLIALPSGNKSHLVETAGETDTIAGFHADLGSMCLKTLFISNVSRNSLHELDTLT